MIEALAAAGLRCPRPAAEQDLCVVWIVLAAVVGVILRDRVAAWQARRPPPD